MSALSTLHAPPEKSHLHAEFLALARVVEQHARITFRAQNAPEQEEAVAEAVAAAFESYVRLKARGQDPVRDFPSAMATFAVLHIKDGRHVGGCSSSLDVLSPKAQQIHGFHVASLPISFRNDLYHPCADVVGREQRDALEEWLRDNTQTPVLDQVCFRLDWPAFLRTLTRRDRALAKFMALGHSAKAAARKFELSQGRVTQLRQQWQREWLVFQGETMVQREAGCSTGLQMSPAMVPAHPG